MFYAYANVLIVASDLRIDTRLVCGKTFKLQRHKAVSSKILWSNELATFLD